MLKSLMVILLGLSSVAALAEEVIVLQARLPLKSNPVVVDVRFKVDENAKEVLIKVVASERIKKTTIDCTGGTIPSCTSRTEISTNHPYHSQLMTLPGLKLDNQTVIYTGDNGQVECGTLGHTRFGRRTLYLSQKCLLSGTVDSSGNLLAKLILLED